MMEDVILQGSEIRQAYFYSLGGLQNRYQVGSGGLILKNKK